MASIANPLRLIRAVPAACALAALCPSAALAQSNARILTPDAFELSGDVRLVAVDGEQGWLDGGLGKLRSGGDGELRVQPQLGNASLVWKPQLSFALGATVVASLQGGEMTRAGLSEAYLSFRPLRGSKTAFSGRAGLMWPPISLEHEGADWHVADSITPSAINSWVGEEVRPVAAEATLAADLGLHKLTATGAVMAANDTAGTLLTFRGWALHDRTTLAFVHQPLPPLGGAIAEIQPRFTHPLLDIPAGFAKRPGYYAKLAWQAPVPVRLELFRYDNEANPEDVNADMEWGWRTQFTQAAAVARVGGTTLKGQAMDGRTRMGFEEAGVRWVDCRFRSAFLLLTHTFGPLGLAVRGEGFETRNAGSFAGADYDEGGWSAMIAAKRQFGRATGLVELLHVSSRREDREDIGLNPRQEQTQLQAQMRIHW